VVILPQFKEIAIMHLHELYQNLPLWEVPFPPQTILSEIYLLNMEQHIVLEFEITRPGEFEPPTRQSSAESFIKYVRQLSPIIHKRFQRGVRTNQWN
jgi:hypothetical protein